MRITHFLLLVSIAFGSCVQNDHAQNRAHANDSTWSPRERIDSLTIVKYVSKFKLTRQVSDGVYQAYASHHWKPIWSDSIGWSQHAILSSAFFWKYLSTGVIDSSHFLPGMHEVFDTMLDNPIEKINQVVTPGREVEFTCQVVLFYHELLRKRSPESIGQLEWYIPIKKGAVDWSLVHDPDAFWKTDIVHPQFNLLVHALQKLIVIEKQGGWKSIPFKGTNLLPGDSSSIITKIKRRLQKTEQYAFNDTSSWFNPSFESAIRKYRVSVGLKDTALIDSAFINRINISAKQRMNTIAININRWKWVPPDTSSRMLRINIPAFELEVVEKGKALKKMDAIIGTPKHHTIMFFDQVRNVVFSPYWNIPKSIVAKELWPQILRNRSYLQNNEMEILKNGQILDPNRIAWHRYNGYNFPYLIRQKPGVKNPLGQVKFIFPNPYNIYIHDTPHKELFEKEQRAFSHGCIRIADSRWLAIYLLKEQPHWTPAMIDSAMVSGQELNITLNSPVPVYITYFTAWVDDEGIVHFRDDVYGHDADMQRELFEPNASK